MQIGILEELIASFHESEVRERLFSLCDVDDLPWWDLVRYNVQMALCVERGIYGGQEAATSPTLVRATSFARQAAALSRDFRQLRRIAPGQLEQMLISTRYSQPIEDTITTMRREGRAALVVNRDGVSSSPHHAIAKQSVDFFTRLSMRAVHMPPAMEIEAREVAAAIRTRFESKLNIFDIIERKYRRHLAAKRVWTFVLDCTGQLERITFINDDTLKTMVFLARKRGITTQEIQHGYMGRSHIGFSYPPLERAPATLPDSVTITRETGDIVYPVSKVQTPTTTSDVTNIPRTIDVLVAASPSNRGRTIEVVAALVGRGWHVAVKLHPAQTGESSGLRQRFSPDELKIHDGDEKFVSLAQRAKIFVPANPMSTTTFEAVENGARLIVVDYGGIKITSQADHIVFARVDSLRNLGEAVATALPFEAN